MTGNRERAILFILQAYKELQAAGTPEQFLDLCGRVHSDSWAIFFSSFGGEKGISLEVHRRESGDILLVFDIIQRRRQGFWSRCGEAMGASWRSWKGQDSRVEVVLVGEDVTKFKDLLRQL